MANEGKRVSGRNLDAHAMNLLTNYRKERGCSLHPKKGDQRCRSCHYVDDCMRYELERAYIHENEERNRAKVLDGAREASQYEVPADPCDVDETIDDLPFDEEEVPFEDEEDSKYPCGPIHYTCSTMECKNGQCPYVPE